MKLLKTILDVRNIVADGKRRGLTIGLVPTMGNLHQGHLELALKCRATVDILVASIFVNPMQFGENEDLDAYPRTLQADQKLLSDAGVDFLFAPANAEMYPENKSMQTSVEVSGLSTLHCGASRPGHFRGVATVVAKLFGIVSPDIAAFGKKDYQQIAVIRQMINDLSMSVNLLEVETVRSSKGLALSSRNGYLTEAENLIAPGLRTALLDAKSCIENGHTDFAELSRHHTKDLANRGFIPEYFVVCNRQTLLPAAATDDCLVILTAAKLGRARLIDNIEVF
ncbi:MAG: pantoate--beta-alanine ligase [Cohaesibacteraceae bacterium]|nr:pantoate--beta-alanine ligase [Cohaesibacteraceae bacterium]